MKTIEYREAAWRLIAAYVVTAVFLATPYLLKLHAVAHHRAFPAGFWIVGAAGGSIGLFIAIYSTIIGRVKIRLTDTAIDYRTFRITIPYDCIKEISEQIPLSRPDGSVKDCVWVRIDRKRTESFGAMAKLAIEKGSENTCWFPVGIVGQAATKRSLFDDLSERIGPAAQPSVVGGLEISDKT